MSEQEKMESSTKVDITPNKDGGVLKEILVEGVGEDKPIPGDTVWVHYVGTLEDGTQFDSSRSRGEQFEFALGKGNVIKAWDIGVATMRKGEKSVLTCRSDYAYGETGSPPKIPANATLIFEVELFRWRGEDISEEKDGSIIRHLVQAGEGYQTPNEGATVKVHYVGKCNDNVYEDREVEFVIGEGEEHGIILGLDTAVKKMKKHEKCRLDIQPSKAYGSEGNSKFNIPPNSVLSIDVELLQFEKAKESWEMSGDEKLEQSNIIKTKGTNCYKAGEYQRAQKLYKKIVSMLENASDLDEKKGERDALLLAAHLNLALCYLKMNNDLEAEHACDSALELDSKNVKAYFRRGQANHGKADYELAIKDFQKVMDLDPSNKAAKNQITLCTQQIRLHKEKEKKTYFGMFNKFAEEDNKKNQQKLDDGFEDIGDWNNDMAAGMMTLQQEMEAFGEEMPAKKTNNHKFDED